MKSYPVYRMVPLSMTLIGSWLGFQGRDIFRQWIFQKRHETFRQWISHISIFTIEHQ